MLRSPEHELPALSLGIPALSCLETRPASCQSQRSTSYDSGPAQFAETTHYHRRTTSDLSQAEVSDMDFHFSVPRSTGSHQFSSPNGSAMIRPLPLHPYSLSRSSSALSEPPAKPDTYSPKKRLRRNTNGDSILCRSDTRTSPVLTSAAAGQLTDFECPNNICDNTNFKMSL